MKLYDEVDDFYPIGYAAQNLKPHEQWLAQRCVLTPSGTWLVLQQTGLWQPMKSQSAASKSMKQNWKGRIGCVCTAKDIDEFMEGEVPVVAGGMIVPSSTSRGIVFGRNTYVNTWYGDCIVQPDAAAAHDLQIQPMLLKLLRMIREALGGKENPLTLPEMLQAANSDDPNELEFRFTMSWLSAIVRKPGINLQTNLVFLGHMTGVGKGLLTGVILPGILGSENCCNLNGEELEHGGWTDALADKLLVVINEIEPSRRFDWNSFIKRNSTEPVVKIRQRNRDSYDALNHANWILTTNQESPDFIDAHDRRNFLSATTNDLSKARLALDLYEWINEHPDLVPRLLEGFVWVLHQQKIHWNMLARAPMTQIKQEAQEGAARDLNGVYWLRNDDRYPRDVPLTSTDLMEYYNLFMKPTHPIGPRYMGVMLGKIARTKTNGRQTIKKEKKYDSRSATWVIPSANFPTQEDLERQAKAEPQVIHLHHIQPDQD